MRGQGAGGAAWPGQGETQLEGTSGLGLSTPHLVVSVAILLAMSDSYLSCSFETGDQADLEFPGYQG